MNHFNKFCISPLCTIDHWVSGKVSAACNNIIKNTSLRIQMRTMSDESWWLGCSWPEGKEGLVLPPHSPPPPTTFEATMASPWSQHRPTKSRHWVLLGEYNVRVCFTFFNSDVSEFSFCVDIATHLSGHWRMGGVEMSDPEFWKVWKRTKLERERNKNRTTKRSSSALQSFWMTGYL